MNRAMLLVGSLVLAGVVAVAAGLGNHTTASGSKSSPSARADATAPRPDGGSLNGTRLVEAGASLRSATTTWRILSSYTAHRIENEYLDTTASGIYMIVKIAATNSTDRPLALSADQVSFEAGGTQYAPDPDSVAALELGGHRGLAIPLLPPDATTTGWVAFDVPPGAISSESEVCFRSRGFGTAAGCIVTG